MIRGLFVWMDYMGLHYQISFTRIINDVKDDGEHKVASNLGGFFIFLELELLR